MEALSHILVQSLYIDRIELVHVDSKSLPTLTPYPLLQSGKCQNLRYERSNTILFVTRHGLTARALMLPQGRRSERSFVFLFLHRVNRVEWTAMNSSQSSESYSQIRVQSHQAIYPVIIRLKCHGSSSTSTSAVLDHRSR